jgi:hypothetical protein
MRYQQRLTRQSVLLDGQSHLLEDLADRLELALVVRLAFLGLESILKNQFQM